MKEPSARCPRCGEFDLLDKKVCQACGYVEPEEVELLTEVRKPGEAFARRSGWKPLRRDDV